MPHINLTLTWVCSWEMFLLLQNVRLVWRRRVTEKQVCCQEVVAARKYFFLFKDSIY